MTNNCLSNKDLKNIVKMLERLMTLELKTQIKKKNIKDYSANYKYIKITLDHNYNYSNILDYLNHVMPLIDDMLDQPNDEVSLPISYEK